MPQTPDDTERERQLTPLYRFWHPRFWPIWLALLILRPLILLPLRWQHFLGRALGRLGARLLTKRRAVAVANLGICFPEKSASEVDELAVHTFESLGIGLFELCFAWWGRAERAQNLTTINGLENMLNPLEQGRGVILVSAHLAAIEMIGLAMSPHRHLLAGLFRPVHNPLVNEILLRARGRSLWRVIPKEDMRLMIRTLKKGKAVWYASDQSYRRKYSALVPFFGEPAMTSLALTHIARISNAQVVPFFYNRLDHGAGYVMDFLPALDNFPTDDPKADALRIHTLIEERIRRAPEQYYWIHRRFKNRPDGYPDLYENI